MGAYEYQLPIIGDINCDGVVDVLDLLEVVNHGEIWVVLLT